MSEELVRVGTADVRAIEAEGVSGRRYRARKGFYEMTPRDAAAMKAVGGFTPTIGGTSIGRPGGYTCARGHRNFFRDCGRCRDLDDRESLRHAGFGPFDPREEGGSLDVGGFDNLDADGRLIYPDPENVEY